MSKHVLYLSYDGIIDPLGQSQIIPYLKGLALNGYTIHLITAEKNIQKENAYRNKKELCDLGILWMYISYTKFPPVLSTLWDIWKIRKKVKQITQSNDIKLTHCRGYITGLIGLSLKLKRGIPFLFDMRGLFADERKESGNWNIKNPVYKTIYKWFKKKEISLLKTADYIISLTEKGKEIIQKEIIKSNLSNIEVIPCCVDLNKFNSTEYDSSAKNKIKQELKIPENSIVFTYLGSIGTWYMLDEMIGFFKLLSFQIPNSIFLFISNESPTLIEEAISRNSADLSRFRMTSQPSSNVPEYLSVSDWGLFFIKPIFSKKASSPTKLAEFLAMGIPVITSAGIGDVDELVLQNNAGIIVKDTTEKSVNNAIQEILTYQRKEPQFYRTSAEKYFDVRSGIDKYSNVYKRIINN
jgi:glycosyltransferase involved in cell wall biosynthesis